MNCSEFKILFPNKIILAFATDETTQLFKFHTNHITFFMRKFIEDAMPYWRHIYFYEVDNLNVELTKDGRITKFEDKAKFLYLWAKHTDQVGNVCVIKQIFLPPDMRLLEGKKAKVCTLSFKQGS